MDQPGAFFQLLTCPGPAAIAVVRARGPQVAEFAETHLRTRNPPQHWRAGQICRAALLDEAGALLDDILVSVHAIKPVPEVRLHLHGSRWIVQRCCQMLRDAGLAEGVDAQPPLWFARSAIEAEVQTLLRRVLTYRGVQWLARQGRLLTEVIEELISDGNPEAGRVRCREIADRDDCVSWFLCPLRVVVAGPPNSGKSTLSNAFADRQVSVVSSTPGTTRDWVEIMGEVNGFPVTWIDTAGLRDAPDPIEAEGARRTLALVQSADVVLWVIDAAAGAAGAITPERWLGDVPRPGVCVAVNKIDLLRDRSAWQRWLPEELTERSAPVSALTGAGLDGLSQLLLRIAGRDVGRLMLAAAFTQRQRDQFRRAVQAATPAEYSDALWRCLATAEQP